MALQLVLAGGLRAGLGALTSCAESSLHVLLNPASLPLCRCLDSIQPAETFNALLLAKSLTKRLWTDSRLETRQLAGIGPQIAQRLADAGVSKLRQLAEVEPRRLESLAQRRYPLVSASFLLELGANHHVLRFARLVPV